MIGKRITLPKGKVVNIIDYAVVNGVKDESIVLTQEDNSNYVGVLLSSVAERLPETVRRNSFNYKPGDVK